MIEGVKIKKLKYIPDSRGRLMEIFRNDDDIFIQFGQVYMTTTYPGVVKAWHYHKKQTDNVVVFKGILRVGLYDDRKDSSTYKEINEFFIGDYNPILLSIPPQIYHGWKCVSLEEGIAVNISTHVYDHNDPDEYRLDPHDNFISFDWNKKDG